MEVRKCPFCREEIKDGAIKCKHCGSTIIDVSHMGKQVEKQGDGTLWLPVPSLVIGIIGFLGSLDDSYWTLDEIVGAMLLTIIGIVLGAVSMSVQKVGKGMAIAGVVMSSISTLILVDLLMTRSS